MKSNANRLPTEFSVFRPQNAPIVIVEIADCEKTETEAKNGPAGDSKAAGVDPATDKGKIMPAIGLQKNSSSNYVTTFVLSFASTG